MAAAAEEPTPKIAYLRYRHGRRRGHAADENQNGHVDTSAADATAGRQSRARHGQQRCKHIAVAESAEEGPIGALRLVVGRVAHEPARALLVQQTIAVARQPPQRHQHPTTRSAAAAAVVQVATVRVQLARMRTCSCH